MKFPSLRPLLLTCLLLAPGACGEVVTNHPDGGSIDATGGDGSVPIDAPIDAQVRGPVTVRVTSTDWETAGQPEPGATVLFYEADGTLAHRTLSDVNGEATAELGPAASITVVRLRATQTLLTTVAAVSPGDTITVGRLPQLSGSGTHTFSATMPTRSGATFYYLQGGCVYGSGQQPSFNATVYNPCPATGDILGLTFISNSPYFLGRNDVSFAAGSSLDLTSETWTFMPQFNLSLTNVPAGLGYLYAERGSLAPNGIVYSDGAYIDQPGAGVHAVGVRYPPGIGRSTIVRLQLEAPRSTLRGNGGSKGQMITAKLGSLPSTYGLDVGALMLPWLERPMLDGNVVRWSAEGGASSGDGTAVDMQWHGNEHYGAWRFILPPGTTETTMPALPDDLKARVDAFIDGSYYTTSEAAVIASDTLDGYAGMRQHGEPIVALVRYDGWRVLQDVPTGILRASMSGTHGD